MDFQKFQEQVNRFRQREEEATRAEEERARRVFEKIAEEVRQSEERWNRYQEERRQYREQTSRNYSRAQEDEKANRDQTSRTQPASGTITADELTAIYRRLAKKWHPDIGGTKEAFQAINEMHTELQKLLGAK